MAQIGNKNAAKSRLFEQALRRAIVQEDGKRLREAAEQLLTLAAAGESWAVRELADRLDGKSTQAVEQTVEHTGNVTHQHLAIPEIDSRIADLLRAGTGSDSPASLPH